MKLQQLKYLLAIADNGLNITAAAEKLFTSQPGVSKQLKLLEEELGLQLFVRKGKSLGGVTAAGEQVIERARFIMEEAENIRSLAANYFQEEEGTLSIATTHTQARYVLPEVVREFRNKYPKVSLNLHQGTSEQIADMVAANDIDFAIATGSHELFRDLLLVPSYHWDRKVIVPNDRAFTEQGLDPDVVFTARDIDVIKTYVRMGLGVGIVAGMANDGEDEDMTSIAATGLFPRSTTWIGFRKDLVLRRYMLEFVSLFAPHITADQLEKTRHIRSQIEIDKLFGDAQLPTISDQNSGKSDSERLRSVAS
jgi:LysR family cys regulon transcriptional activator